MKIENCYDTEEIEPGMRVETYDGLSGILTDKIRFSTDGLIEVKVKWNDGTPPSFIHLHFLVKP